MSTKNRWLDPRAALAVALVIGAAGCGDSGVLGVYDGSVRFVLTPDASFVPTGQAASTSDSEEPAEHGDRPSSFFQSANVTFSSIVARNLDGVLTDVAMELPVTVDIVTMEDGRQITLPDGELPPATYDQLVVVMTNVEGVTHDGTTISITPPGGGWTAIVPVCPFTVDDGATTVVGLSFNLRDAFKWYGDRYHFQPRFRCDTADDDGETPSPS